MKSILMPSLSKLTLQPEESTREFDLQSLSRVVTTSRGKPDSCLIDIPMPKVKKPKACRRKLQQRSREISLDKFVREDFLQAELDKLYHKLREEMSQMIEGRLKQMDQTISKSS